MFLLLTMFLSCASSSVLHAMDPQPTREMVSLEVKEIAGASGPRKKVSPRVLKFSQEGDFLLAGSSDGTVRLWDVNKKPLEKPSIFDLLSRKNSKHVDVCMHTGVVSALCCAHKWIVSGGQVGESYTPKGKLMLWAKSTGRRVQSIKLAGVPYAIEFHPESSDVFAVSHSKSVLLFDVRDPQEVVARVGVSEYSCNYSPVSFSPDGMRLLCSHNNDSSLDSMMSVVDVRMCDHYHDLFTYELEGVLTACRFEPEGDGIAFAELYRSICIASLANLEINKLPFRYDGAISEMAYSSDGKLVTSAKNKNGAPVRVFDCNDTKKRPGIVHGVRCAPVSALHPNGTHVATVKHTNPACVELHKIGIVE